MVKHIIYIGMGSNLSSAAEVLAEARLWLAELSDDEVVFSMPVRTEPVNFPWPAMFTNQVARLTTTMTPTAVKTSLKRMERKAGRTRVETLNGIIRLDLDLLAVDGRVLKPSDWQRPYIRQGVDELKQLS